jgi:hypothetical protein
LTIQDQITLSTQNVKYLTRQYSCDWYDLYENIYINKRLYFDEDVPERLWRISKNTRLVIYPKDIEMIYGESNRFARYLLQTIRKAFRKRKDQPVTIKEFCDYTGMNLLDVSNFITES